MKLWDDLDEATDIDFKRIETSEFPFSCAVMFNMFPESVLQESCKIFYNLLLKEYDTIVIGFQTWFLRLFLTVMTYSQIQDFSSLVKDEEVYLVMDCINSWRVSMSKR